jgi:hypothetical protein
MTLHLYPKTSNQFQEFACHINGGASAGRCRCDQPVRLQRSRQVPDQRGQHGAAGPVQAGLRLGAAQNRNLMPPDEPLCVFAC